MEKKFLWRVLKKVYSQFSLQDVQKENIRSNPT